MTVLAVAKGWTWTTLVVDAVKGRQTDDGTKFDAMTDKICRVGDAYASACGDEVNESFPQHADEMWWN